MGYIDVQKYDGFVCYAATGTGNTRKVQPGVIMNMATA